MPWNEDCQNEIDRLIGTQDIAEVITKAVSQIVDGHLGRFAMQLNVYNGGCDPAQIQDFGERLLCAAIDKLMGK